MPPVKPEFSAHALQTIPRSRRSTPDRSPRRIDPCPAVNCLRDQSRAHQWKETPRGLYQCPSPPGLPPLAGHHTHPEGIMIAQIDTAVIRIFSTRVMVRSLPLRADPVDPLHRAEPAW